MWRVSHFENWTPAGFLLETFAMLYSERTLVTNQRTKNWNLALLPAVILFCSSIAIANPTPRLQEPPPPPAADNTKKNQDQTPPTADQQKVNPSDRAITQKIRKAIHNDDSLSNYAHNIKIITQGGKVTLRGPVRSEDEKTSLEAKAVAVAGQENVTNQLEIAPSK
jgi:hyperosmotically inducible periplasmic protein